MGAGTGRSRVRSSVMMGALLALGVAVGIGCGGTPPPVELPVPSSGRFLTLEEQHALGRGQLEQYCRMLDQFLDSVRTDITLARRMADSLSVVSDSLNTAHQELNLEMQRLQGQVQRLKSMRKGPTSYIVQDGDTLMKLAALFYGSSAEWRKIYNANKDVIDDPAAPLKAGLKITVPQ
jgi:nucleoid-associated protein YgaU